MNPDPTSLERLHDIVASPPVPWWPPAPGWWWLLGFLVVTILILLVRAFLVWQRDRYRRDALAELARQEVMFANPGQRGAALAAMAGLLKRAALTAWPRAQVAALHGPAWFAFLDRTGGTHRFSFGAGALLENAAYDPRQAQQLDEPTVRAMISLVRHWLRHHRVEITKQGTR